jgi:hypothetical protein
MTIILGSSLSTALNSQLMAEIDDGGPIIIDG